MPQLRCPENHDTMVGEPVATRVHHRSNTPSGGVASTPSGAEPVYLEQRCAHQHTHNDASEMRAPTRDVVCSSACQPSGTAMSPPRNTRPDKRTPKKVNELENSSFRHSLVVFPAHTFFKQFEVVGVRVGVHARAQQHAGHRHSLPCILQPRALAKKTRVEQAHQLCEAVIHTRLAHPPCHPHHPWHVTKEPTGENYADDAANADTSRAVQICAFARLRCREANSQRQAQHHTTKSKGRTDGAQTLPSSTLSVMTAMRGGAHAQRRACDTLTNVPHNHSGPLRVKTTRRQAVTTNRAIPVTALSTV